MQRRLMKRMYGVAFDMSTAIGALVPHGKMRAWWFVRVTAPLMDTYWRLDHGVNG